MRCPNGDFLAFSANGYLIEDYYSSDSDPDAPRADQIVMADTVVQFTPEGENRLDLGHLRRAGPLPGGLRHLLELLVGARLPRLHGLDPRQRTELRHLGRFDPGVAAEPERHRQGGLRDPGHQVDTRAPRRLARKPAGPSCSRRWATCCGPDTSTIHA